MPTLTPTMVARIWVIVTVMTLLLTVSSSSVTAQSTSARATEEPTNSRAVEAIDLAFLLPGVLALEEIGLDDLVPYQTDERAALGPGVLRGFQTRWADAAAVREADGGIDQGIDPVSLVVFYATQFETEEAAQDYFRDVATEDEVLEDTGIELGDETVITDTAVTFNKRTELVGNDIMVRVGMLQLGVTVLTQEDSSVRGDELDLASSLIQGYVERVTSLEGLPRNTIGLDVVRFGHISKVNSYVIRDGESVVAFLGESPSARETYNSSLRDSGVVAQYQIEQEIQTEELERASFGYIIGRGVTQYQTTRQAKAHFASTIPYREDEGFTTTLIEDAPALGDESVAFEATNTDGSDYFAFVVWRDGKLLRWAFLELPTRVAERDALFALVAVQTECLESGTCHQEHALPEEVVKDAGQPPQSLPAPAATPSAGRRGGDMRTP